MLYGAVGKVGLRASAAPFSPASLFAAGEQGVWYDPSDMTTLFQDAAGTTPLTAVEQPVGLVLDKSKGSVGTNGSKRLNFLSWTEAFDNAAWTNVGSTTTVTANNAIAPDGTLTADRFVVAGADGVRYQPVSVQAGATYTFSCWLRGTAGETLGFGASNSTSVGATNTPITLTADWVRYTHQFTITSSGTANLFPGSTYIGATARTFWVWGADLRLSSEASTLPTYQRITADWPSTMSGAHASQSTSASRPVLSARVNLLTYSETFSNAAWDDPNITPTAAGFSWPYGSSATLWTSTGNFTAVRQAITVTSGVSVKAIFVLKKGSFDWVRLGIFDDALWGGTHNVQVWFNLGTGAKGTSATNGSGTLTNYDISSLGDGWHLCSITASLPATTYSFGLAGVTADGGSTRVTNGTLYGGGADLRVSNAGVNLPVYQRVVTATDYDTTGFPMYLKFDGTDDSMETGTINPGSVDKAQVFAGVRKVSGAAQGMLLEMSSVVGSNPGTFNVQAPSGAGDNYEIRVRGSVTPAPFSLFDVASPATSVLGGLFSISEDIIDLRLNGTTVATSSADMGTGNFLSYPLFIGSRAGTSLRFNGHLYSLILRFSATNLPDATIAQTETWVNGKTGAY